jgi:hypothetical protein
MQVLREIPAKTSLCLTTGNCVQHGGVIRVAAGRDGAGQIVKHLILPRGTQSMAAVLDPAVPQLLATASQTMALAQVSLAVSAVGFAVIFGLLIDIERKLGKLAKDVQAIQDLLKRREQSELRNSLESLAQLDRIGREDARIQVITTAHRDLGIKLQLYGGLLADSDSLELAEACEQYYCLIALGRARCHAEMEAVGLAADELEASWKTWRMHAQRIAREYMLGDDSVRFLHAEFADEVSVGELCQWMDFAHAEQRGQGWLDSLRHQLGPYYEIRDRRSKLPNVRGVHDGIRGGIGSIKNRIGGLSQTELLGRDVENIVPLLRQMEARDNVLSGYITQYRLMQEYKLSPAQLEAQLAALPQDADLHGFIVLGAQELAVAAD